MNLHKKLWFWPLAGVLVLGAFFIRYYQIEFENFSYDEMISLYFAKQGTWRSLFWDNTPGLFPVLYRGWVKLAGDGEIGTRLYSVLWSLATLILLGVWFVRRLKPIAALCGVALAGTQFLTILWARDARLYAQFEFFSTWYLLEILELQNPSRTMSAGGRARLIISGLGMTLTSFLGAIPLAISLAWMKRKNAVPKQVWWGMAALAAALVTAYWLSDRTAMGWTHFRYKVINYPLSPHPVLWDLFNRSWICIGAMGILGYYLWRGRKELPPEVKFLLVYLLGPFVLILVLAAATQNAFFLPRYFIYLVPAVTLLWLHAGLEKRRVWALGLFWLGAALSVPEIYVLRKAPWRSVAEMIGATPRSVVYTRASVGIQEPYFSAFQVPVKKMVLGKESVPEILEDFDTGHTPWVVESLSGGYGYFDSLQVALEQKGMRSEIQTLSGGEEEPIVVLKVTIWKPRH